MWIMVEPIAEIPFGIRQSPTRCYGCNTPLFAKVYINMMHMPISGGYCYIVQG
jgi:hypothetical protein